MRQIKTTANLDKARGGKTLSYDEYVVLLKSAATQYDESVKGKKVAKRTVYQHELVDQPIPDISMDDPDDDHGVSFDIETPVDTIHAYATEQRNRIQSPPKLARMPRDRWHKLTRDGKEIWDRMKEQDKATVLGIEGDFTAAQPTKQGPTLKKMLKANLHEFSPAGSSDMDVSFDLKEPDTVDDGPDESDDIGHADLLKILVNAAKTSSERH